jgi:serine/threonine protein kinase
VVRGFPVDYPSDIWSLGMTAIEIAEGMLPHEDKNSAYEVMLGIIQSPSPTLRQPFWSRDFKDFVSRCVAKEPRDRLSAEALLTHPFITAGPANKQCIMPLLKRVHLGVAETEDHTRTKWRQGPTADA